MTGRPTRVAIVGGGPRAVHALESLARAGGDAATLAVEVLDPRPVLGVGPGYDPAQPDFLRLNVTSAAVSVWPGGGGPSLDDWRRADRQDEPLDPYPSRALAGRYLAEAGRRLVATLDATHRRERVEAVLREPDGWRVRTGQGDSLHDAVLLVTGHAEDWWGALARRDPRAVPALPLDRLAAHARPGIGVAVRGAALTAIDATLALTVGRGDTLTASTYAPGPDAVAAIGWHSRTGRLMVAKPEPHVVAGVPGLEDLVDAAGGRIAADEPATAVVLDLATEILRACGSEPDVDPVLVVAGAHPVPSAVDHWEATVAMARGERPPDSEWALGLAWRRLLPALQRRHRGLQADGGHPAEGWAELASWTQALERLAFGPPVATAALMATLARAGVVTVGTGPTPADAGLLVDAVLAPPGIVGLDDPLWRSLRSGGLVEVPPQRRGARVDLDGTSVVDGQRLDGLAIVGRATEDVVLGNDTLNRDEHPALDLWARTVTKAPVAPERV